MLPQKRCLRYRETRLGPTEEEECRRILGDVCRHNPARTQLMGQNSTQRPARGRGEMKKVECLVNCRHTQTETVDMRSISELDMQESGSRKMRRAAAPGQRDGAIAALPITASRLGTQKTGYCPGCSGRISSPDVEGCAALGVMESGRGEGAKGTKSEVPHPPSQVDRYLSRGQGWRAGQEVFRLRRDHKLG
jgi:hypothetical protein